MFDAYSMLASVIAGLIIGFNLDKFFRTSPFLMLIFAFLGIGLSIYNVLKKTK